MMNAISIRTNRLDVWKIVARNYPQSIKQYKIFCVIEDKLHTSEKDVLDILTSNNITNYEIIHSTEMENALEPHLSNKDFLKLYKGNTMTLTSWYIRNNYEVSKLLMLDEDVILTKDFIKVFAYSKNAFYSYDGNIARDKTEETNAVWLELFGKESILYTPWSNPVLHINDKIDAEKELQNIIKIYQHPHFINKAISQRAWHLSYFDQTALGMLYYDRNDFVDLRKNTSLIVMGESNINYGKIIRDIKSKSFVHLCCKSKLTILKTLVKEGVLIDGDIL